MDTPGNLVTSWDNYIDTLQERIENMECNLQQCYEDLACAQEQRRILLANIENS
jgi:hypothetical protein